MPRRLRRARREARPLHLEATGGPPPQSRVEKRGAYLERIWGVSGAYLGHASFTKVKRTGPYLGRIWGVSGHFGVGTELVAILRGKSLACLQPWLEERLQHALHGADS